MEEKEIISSEKNKQDNPAKGVARVQNLDETQTLSQAKEARQKTEENGDKSAEAAMKGEGANSVWKENDTQNKKDREEGKTGETAVKEQETKVPTKTVVSTGRRYLNSNGKPGTKPVNHQQIKKEAETGEYTILNEVAKGAESVLYAAKVGNHEVCVKAIRNKLNRIIGAATTRKQMEKLNNVPYHTKLRHIQNEYKVSQQLFSDKEIPVVHIYALRRVTFWGIELGYDLIMEMFNGHDLGEKQTLKSLGKDDKIRAVYQCLQALDYLHKRHYIHLDIKPSNFILHNGKVKLLDFGVSVQNGYKPKAITGTGGYLSPEQVCKEPLDEKTDIFALGLTFAVLLGGKSLQQPQNDLLSKQFRLDAKYHLEHDEISVITELPELTDMPEFAQIIKDCSIPRRDKRPASCQVLMARIKAWAADKGFKLEV